MKEFLNIKRSTFVWNILLILLQIILPFISIFAFCILEWFLFIVSLGIILDLDDDFWNNISQGENYIIKTNFWFWFNTIGILAIIIFGIYKLCKIINKHVIIPFNDFINQTGPIKLYPNTIDPKLKIAIKEILAGNIHKNYLDKFARQIFNEKYGNQSNVWYAGFEVIDENTILINYEYGNMSDTFIYCIIDKPKN